MKEPVRVALIGLGAVAEHYYVPALRELIDEHLISVDALFDPAVNRVAKFHEIFPLAVTMDNLSQLKDRKIELAIVATPAAFHAQQSIQAMDNGCGVLCEKPMATSVAECHAMIDVANKKNLVLAVGHVRRHFPALKVIKEVLSSNLLGNVKGFKFTEGGPFQWPAASKSFFSKEQAGGGVFLDTGVHVVDLMLWWFGQPSSVLYEDDSMGGLEANCRLTLKYDGFDGLIQLSRDWWLSNKYEIDCEKGRLTWQVGETNAVTVTTINGDTQLANSINKLGSTEGSHGNCFADQLRAVVSKLSAIDSAQIVTGQEAMENLQFIDNCYKNRKLMPMPWLTEKELETAGEL